MYDAPLITIGITSYNCVETIERALHSALDQDWPNKEIVVVDDASTDGSVAAIEKIAQRNGSVRLINHPTNRGMAAGLNRLISEARGEFIAFFDDDDISERDRIRKQWLRLTNYEAATGASLVLCYSNRRVIRPGESKATECTYAIGRTGPEPSGPIVADYILLLKETPPFVWGQFGSCTILTRPETLKMVHGFDTEFRRGAEWDMAVRAALAGAHFIAVDEPLVTQFLTAGLGAEKSARVVLGAALQLRMKHRHLLQARGLYPAAIAQAHARFHYAKRQHVRRIIASLAAAMLAPRTLLPQIVEKSRLGRWWRDHSARSS